MRILIEFYHKNILDNMVAVLGAQPDIVMFYFDPVYFTHTAVYNTYLACRRYIPRLKLELGTCDSTDFWALEDKLSRYIRENAKDEIFIDLTGSNDLAAVASYSCSREGKIDLLYSDIRRSRILCINHPEKRYGYHCFEISDIIEGAGGKILSCANGDYLDKNREALESGAQYILENISSWSYLCSWLQKNGAGMRDKHSLHFQAALTQNARHKKNSPDTRLLHFLARTRLIQHLSITKNEISFDYRDRESLNYLTTYGVWLEFVTYYALKSSQKFHDVKNSLKVDWNRNDTQDIIGNEVDVTAMYGCIPVIISCKMSENATDADAVNELYAVSHRISRGHVIRVLVTFCDIKQRRHGIYLKAREMGIIVMDEADVRHPEFAARLERAICQKQNIIR